MAWLTDKERSQRELSEMLRMRIQKPEILKIPGAHDAMAGLVAKETGFEVLYLSGGAYTASRGLPDIGLITVSEIAERARDIIRATNLPLLVDIDTGYGGVLNAVRTAKEMVEARVAGVQIEDQDLPKKCGHLNGKNIIPAEEMAAKIRAMRETVPTLTIIARTDAYAQEGVSGTVERALQYREAGADGIFPEGLDSAESFQRVAEKVPGPLLANMTEFGRTPYFSADQFEQWGYRMVLFPVSSLRVAAKAYANLYRILLEEGTQISVLSAMQTRQELYDLIHYWDYEALDAHIARTILPTSHESTHQQEHDEDA